MFDSLKSWMTAPIQVRHFVRYNAAADKEYEEPEEIRGYIVGNVVTVTDSVGEDVVSSTQIYFDPSKYNVGSLDLISVDGEEKNVIQITNYVDGNTGNSSIKVAYL